MLRLLGAFFLIALITAGVGYYMGWFAFTTTKDAQGTHLSVLVDKTKIEADRQVAKRKLDELGSKGDATTTPARR